MITIHKYQDQKWKEAGLPDVVELDKADFINQREDYCDSLKGRWWYEDDLEYGRKVIYTGSFANDHSPGCNLYTVAFVFSFGKEDYELHEGMIKELEKQPEYED